MVEVQKLRTFYDFCKPRATLCGARACRSALAVAPCEFVAREMAFGSCLVAHAPAFAIPRSRVRRSSGWKIATFKYKNSTRSTFPQLRQHLRRATCAESLAQSNLRSANCTERLHKALAQRNLVLAQTNLHRAHAQSACAEQLAQSTCAEQLAQSTCAEQPAQSTCVQQRAESNLTRSSLEQCSLRRPLS